MKTYIGTKIIKAQIMSAEDATVKLGRKLTLDNAKAEIATVGDGVMEYHPGYLVEYPDGYKSWSPKEQFEEAYSEANEECTSPIMKYFVYKHLPEHLQEISRPIGLLAMQMDMLPDSAEKSAGLRKLLEAKDCLVRAAL